MNTEVPPVRIVVTFSGPNTADGQVSTEGQVTVGQLALAAWLLERAAQETRAAVMAAQARDAMQVATLAAGIRNGGRG